MKFEEGQSGNPAGRPKGAINKLTKTVKQTVLEVFNKLQEDENFSLEWFAKKYPRDYYAIAAKLIPQEVTGELDFTINWSETKTYNDPNAQTDSGS